MHRFRLITGCLLTVSTLLLPLRADDSATGFEKALYAKSRYDVVSNLNDQDFASYCVTLGIGGDTLLKFHDDILADQTQLAILVNDGHTADDPQVQVLNTALRLLRAEYAVKIAEARKGLEIESNIAEETLNALGRQK